MTIKDEIMKCFNDKQELTNLELSEKTGIDIDSIRTIIKRDLENKFIEFTGQYKNRFKIYKLKKEPEEKETSNNLFRDVKKAFKSLNLFFARLTKNIVNGKLLTLEEYNNLVKTYINRDFIKKTNEKLKGDN